MLHTTQAPDPQNQIEALEKSFDSARSCTIIEDAIDFMLQKYHIYPLLSTEGGIRRLES